VLNPDNLLVMPVELMKILLMTYKKFSGMLNNLMVIVISLTHNGLLLTKVTVVVTKTKILPGDLL